MAKTKAKAKAAKSVKAPKARPAKAKPAKAAPAKAAKVAASPTVIARKPSAERLARAAAPPPVRVSLPPVLRAPTPPRPVATRPPIARPVAVTPIAPPAPARIVPPPPAKELDATRPLARLLQHGEVFGKHRLETRHLPTPVVLPTGRIALGDALAPDLRVLDRRLPPGRYRCMLALAGAGAEQRLAAIVMYCGRPPIARWVHAQLEGKRPPKAEADAPSFAATVFALVDASAVDRVKPALRDAAAPARVALDAALRPIGAAWAHASHVFDEASGLALAAFVSGKGSRDHAAYWGLDAGGQPVCLVVDAGLLAAGDWKQPRGR